MRLRLLYHGHCFDGVASAAVFARHRETVETIRRKAHYARGVVTFDLVDEGLAGFNKFIPYYVCPETTYSVAVTRGPARTKISVGSNPFSPRPRRHNIASICERYGGGGHAGGGAGVFLAGGARGGGGGPPARQPSPRQNTPAGRPPPPRRRTGRATRACCGARR